jgi:hypothetical protein
VSAIKLNMLNMMQADLFLDDDLDGGRKQQQRERRFDFDKVLKMTTHADVLELYLFVLQRYKTLDAQTLHAITSFLTRFCDKLNLEPMLYQVCSCIDLWASKSSMQSQPSSHSAASPVTSCMHGLSHLLMTRNMVRMLDGVSHLLQPFVKTLVDMSGTCRYAT